VLYADEDLHTTTRQRLEREGLELLKFALCSGLYPHFAVADKFNQYRKSGEFVFHTASGQQVLLHPSSSLQARLMGAALAGLSSSDGSVATSSGSSDNPLLPCELYCFVKVLETRKPYLTSVFTCPGLQTLLLLARRLDADAEFGWILVDGWLLFQFKDAAVGHRVLRIAFILRRALSRLMNSCLSDGGTERFVTESAAVGSIRCEDDELCLPVATISLSGKLANVVLAGTHADPSCESIPNRMETVR
jgi:hypothetical protein